jgi:secretion/DNA translocation related CpaE-like protein
VQRQRRPLVVTAEAELLDALLGAASAAGVAVDVAVDLGSCRPQWISAPLVLVGADVAPALADADLPRRPGVLLVGREAVRPDVAGTGAEEVLALPFGEEALVERLADAAEPAGAARVMGILSGCGGAGGSVFAAVLALTAAGRSGPVWLVDLDPLGGGVDVVLGAELADGARWTDLGEVNGRLSTQALRDAVPLVSGVSVISADRVCDPDVRTVAAVLEAARRGGGTVILDLPRQPTEARDHALHATDDLLVVVPAEVRSVLATRQLLHRLGPTASMARAVVRTVPAGVRAIDVAHALGLTLAGELPDEAAVRAAIRTGRPQDLPRGSALVQACSQLLTATAAHGDAA